MGRRGRSWFVPEVLQTSMMDCGPATLKAVLDGFHRPVNLERLRERCQTDVDGTSLSALQEAAERLGLECEQIMVPKDSLLLPECGAAPAIVFLANPEGLLHFVVLWSVVGSYVQIMDPGRGRVWMRHSRFLDMVANLTVVLPESEWREWAGGADFVGPLTTKLRSIRVPPARVTALIARAEQDPSSRAYAALDATTRFVRSLVVEGAVRAGGEATLLLEALFASDAVAPLADRKVPPAYWMCSPSNVERTVSSTGVVLLRFELAKDRAEESGEVAAPVELARMAEEETEHTKVMPGAPASQIAATRIARATARSQARLSMVGVASPRLTKTSASARGSTTAARTSMWAGPVLSAEVRAELSASRVKPHRIFANMLWTESRASVVALALLVVVGVTTGFLDVMMMRGLASTIDSLTLPIQRIGAVLAVALFLIFAFGIDLAGVVIAQRLARGLECRLRVAFLEKLPQLDDRYFRSRPVSDMTMRAHLLQTLRTVPTFVISLITNVLNIIVTTGILIWLEPRLEWLALGLLVVSLSLPIVSYRLLDESLARLRIHGAALAQYYLDALRGVLPIRVHGAERAVRREHEGLLTEWVRTGRSVETTTLGVFAFTGYLSTFVSVGLVGSFVARGGDLRSLLLLALFALRLPTFAEALVKTVRSYPLLKHDALRLFEPLTAAETLTTDLRRVKRGGPTRGVNLVFRGVSAVAGGRDVLKGLNLEIAAGTHVAIVGPSGAGKSSLVSVLLGWLFVSEGTVLIDGRPLDSLRLAQLREETAWVDPGIQLWNQSLLENLLYGHAEDAFDGLEAVLESADLRDVVERLPDGLQSSLGEGGACVSGGQGQRVRLGRAMLKRDARLVILDEPFRGLERDKRRALLAAARALWPTATLLYVSHDVSDTLEMDQVVVVNDGEIAERGPPADLLARDTFYGKLVATDREARSAVWGRPEWRHIAFVGDELREEAQVAE